ncbi:DUF2339 domain-containing protein [Terricaulis sp.]|uniref:DUF2339 domain-containing protein n=1 Tax=Terricaulis sp. TaxID=2768686 RepID=UPI003782F8E1
MEWLFILGLAGWGWWQSRRIETLETRLRELDQRLFAAVRAAAWNEPLKPLPEEGQNAAPPAPIVTSPAPPEPAAELPPIVFTPAPPPPPLATTPWPDAQPLAPTPPQDDREPLLLDQPIPDDELVLDTPLPPIPRAAIAEPIEPTRPQRTFRFDRWLAENGIAWIGGGFVAIALILGVGLMARQGWFTPSVRLSLATVLGLVLLGVSEVVRRGARGNALVAALLAGAGVTAFYATAWAAHGIYGFIGWPLASSLLALCAAILVSLSFRHGQALGVLAVGAALLAPALTHAGLWPWWPLTLFVCAVGAAGIALAWLKRWAWVALATLAGLYYWYADAIAGQEIGRAVWFLALTSFAGVTLGTRPPLDDEPGARLSWKQVHELGPTIAICFSSVILIWAWLGLVPSTRIVAATTMIAAFHAALAGAAVRARVASPMTLAVAIGTLVVGFVAYLRLHSAAGAEFYPAILFSGVVVASSALLARPHRESRTLVAASGAIGAALLVLLSATTRVDWHGPAAWAALFTSAALLMGAAWLTARDTAAPDKDRAVDFWVGASAALALIGIESAFWPEWRTAAYGVAALVFAALFMWRAWRATRYAALAAAALTLAQALSANLAGLTMAGGLALWQALLILAIAAGALAEAAFLTARKLPKTTTQESLSAAAILIVLLGVFLTLRWIASGGAGAPLDAFTEVALRTLALTAAGHVAMARGDANVGPITQWRGHVLMGAGLAYGFWINGLGQNPWWGVTPAAVAGPYLFDSLLLAYAAPAALALLASNRLYLRQRIAARVYAASGGLLALIWAFVEVRRFFHPQDMSPGPVGLFEGACYGLIFLAAALAVVTTARMRAAHALGKDRPFTHDLMVITRGVAWTGIVLAAITLLLLRHPWWGVQNGDETNALSTGLATLAQGVALALALFLGRALSRKVGPDSTRYAAAAAAALFAWSFGHSGVRWLHQYGAMDDSARMIGLEGYAHSLWPLALVLLASEITRRAPGRDTVRSYLYDLQAIWAAAVWPALAFAGLGSWVLFSPWWGAAPAALTSPFSAALAFGGMLLAAVLSFIAPRVPKIPARDWFERAALVACVAHLFVALTLFVRFIYRGDAMAALDPAVGFEMWTYSAVWALFGGAVLTLGAIRRDQVLRWCGLAILMATSAKVLFVDTARLSGLIRVASFMASGAVLLFAAWATRRIDEKPEDLLRFTSNGQHEKPNGRRQRSQ